jgi:hypothetical protein
MMHLKLNDITDKFSLNQLSEIYKIPAREILQQKTYKTLLFLKLKSRLELNKLYFRVYDFTQRAPVISTFGL